MKKFIKAVIVIIFAAIIGYYCFVAMLMYIWGQVKESRDAITPIEQLEKQLHTLQTPLEKYKLDNGAYPSGLVYLWVCPSDDNGNWQGPYWYGDDKSPDPWGRPLKYELFDRGQRCKITSAGADGQFGTPDDKYEEYGD